MLTIFTRSFLSLSVFCLSFSSSSSLSLWSSVVGQEPGPGGRSLRRIASSFTVGSGRSGAGRPGGLVSDLRTYYCFSFVFLILPEDQAVRMKEQPTVKATSFCKSYSVNSWDNELAA